MTSSTAGLPFDLERKVALHLAIAHRDDVVAGRGIVGERRAVEGIDMLALVVAGALEDAPIDVLVADGIEAFGEPRHAADVLAEIGIGGRLLRRLACDLGALRRRHRLGQRAGQARCVAGVEIDAAGGARDALQLALRQGIGDVEADYMGGEADAGLLQFGGGRARIGRAGLDAVGDQDHGRLGLGGLQRGGGLAQRIRDRRLALRIDAVDRGLDPRRIELADRHHQLDVLAIALRAMAVDHDAEPIGRIPFRQDRIDGLPRRGDLALPFDLAPHRAGGVEHENGVGALRLGVSLGLRGMRWRYQRQAERQQAGDE
jgi:hypothetical protein